MARTKDADRKVILAADDAPAEYAGWMCATDVEEHFQEGGAKAEAYIRGVAKRLGAGAEVYEITGKTIAKRALAAPEVRSR